MQRQRPDSFSYTAELLQGHYGYRNRTELLIRGTVSVMCGILPSFKLTRLVLLGTEEFTFLNTCSWVLAAAATVNLVIDRRNNYGAQPVAKLLDWVKSDSANRTDSTYGLSIFNSHEKIKNVFDKTIRDSCISFVAGLALCYFVFDQKDYLMACPIMLIQLLCAWDLADTYIKIPDEKKLQIDIHRSR